MIKSRFSPAGAVRKQGADRQGLNRLLGYNMIVGKNEVIKC